MLITDWNRIAADPQGYASRHYEAMGFPSAEEAVAWLAEQGVNVGRTPDANN
jgi:viroplasmin and RNaseH domain-containing protein